ncbi:hypothetical protein FUA23_13005 [Neolewinella aurantiaca]|uniref:DUF2029 domain-containing protein n=1 Tax=Neolewinella aurantiaca TaxID=2602767 RepID=A0A5C7FRL8_9BACT|nr:hypothetical protein [Neolewinella aurantiaca]TXF88764.1 hypothetical protein FUA23_13005 [Neolewinella aurantiaca]
MWKSGKPLSVSLVGGLLLAVGVFYLGYGVDRTDFWSLFGAFVLAFGGYLALVYRPDETHLRWLVGLGIVLRVALVFGFPLLSDDVYRFIWDGHLIAAGHNPFAELPAHYLTEGQEVTGLSQELFDLLNSPDYYTIYPPVAQGVFTLAVWVSPDSWYGAAVVMKLFLLACELGSLWLLWRLLAARTQDAKNGFSSHGLLKNVDTLPAEPTPLSRGEKGLSPTNLLFYCLNPLIIVEIMGNLHFEGAMVFFLLLAYYLLQRSKWIAAGVAMAASVASKLLPLMLLPLLIRRLWEWPVRNWWRSGKRFYVFSLAFGIACLLFFAPLLLSPGFLDGFQSSLELYQKKFEFNASIYYVARAIGYLQVGWNQIATIGPSLAKAAAAGILLLALLDRRRDWVSLPVGWLWAFVLYLLCATTVHPWYLSVPIVLCCFTRWRFPLVWSFLIMLTYVSYIGEPYQEDLWLVGGEYVLVFGFFIWEIIAGRQGTKPKQAPHEPSGVIQKHQP